MDWNDLRLLDAAVRAGSLSGAARELGLAQATLSRRMAALEASVGHTLFVRSRSGLNLTEAGEALLPAVRGMSAAAVEVQAAVRSLDDAPRGTVRVAVPAGLAVDVLVPLAATLRARHPLVVLHLMASTRVVDLDADEAELAVRLVRPSGGDLVARRLADLPLTAWVSPGLAAKLPVGAAVHEVPWVGFPPQSANPSSRWLATAGPGGAAVKPVFVSDDFLVLRAAAQAGVGALISGGLPGGAGGPQALLPYTPAGVQWPMVTGWLVARRSVLKVPAVQAVYEALAAQVDAMGLRATR